MVRPGDDEKPPERSPRRGLNRRDLAKTLKGYFPTEIRDAWNIEPLRDLVRRGIETEHDIVIPSTYQGAHTLNGFVDKVIRDSTPRDSGSDDMVGPEVQAETRRITLESKKESSDA